MKLQVIRIIIIADINTNIDVCMYIYVFMRRVLFRFRSSPMLQHFLVKGPIEKLILISHDVTEK